MEHFDVLIVGAGISGICAGYYLQKQCPGKRFAILEGREALGGTWDLFRYPGIRSDSDMLTLGYSFRPWLDEESIADGPKILQYLKDTVKEYKLDDKIRYNQRVQQASWSSENARWTVRIQVGDETQELTCNFLMMCSGYYNYERGYTPEFPGFEDFQGDVIHPQKWHDDIDYEGKRVVVIGSGATAVTLIPSMADKAKHITMLQRSPTYIISRPAKDRIGQFFRSLFLPKRMVYHLIRWKNILMTMYFYNVSKRRPQGVKDFLLKQLRRELGEDFDIDKHFTPSYDPWDQRICLVPNGDLLKALKRGDVSIETDHIERFTQDGIALKSGKTLEADMIVTATGLELLFMGNVELQVDGETIESQKTMSYKGAMFRDIPNLALSMGYINASWTLKCELICEYVCRVLNHMDEKGLRQVTPRQTDPSVEEIPFMGLSSSYIKRAENKLPKQGSKGPWKMHQNYVADIKLLRRGPIEDGVLEFKP